MSFNIFFPPDSHYEMVTKFNNADFCGSMTIDDMIFSMGIGGYHFNANGNNSLSGIFHNGRTITDTPGREWKIGKHGHLYLNQQFTGVQFRYSFIKNELMSRDPKGDGVLSDADIDSIAFQLKRFIAAVVAEKAERKTDGDI